MATKKLLAGFFALTILFSACKKDDDAPVCALNATNIAGTYKISKVETIAGGTTIDVTGSFLDNCTASGLYKLNSDNTLQYTELPSCGGNGTGTWNLTDGKLSIIQTGNAFEFVNANVVDFNCSGMSVDIVSTPGSSIRFSFARQ